MTARPDTGLDDAALEVIVRRVAARLQIDRPAPDGLLSAAQVATRLGMCPRAPNNAARCASKYVGQP